MTAPTVSPRRLQRRRQAGWRKPEGAVIVTRPSRWGNPFAVGHLCPLFWTWRGHWVAEPYAPDWVRDRTHAVDLYRNLARQPAFIADARRELAGRDLLCWCPLVDADGQPVPCHADILLDVANSQEGAR